MKLFFCPKCQDIVKVHTTGKRSCACKESFGVATEDSIHIVLSGYAIPLGTNNSDFVRAAGAIPEDDRGICFEAFFIPKKCSTVEHEDKDKAYAELASFLDRIRKPTLSEKLGLLATYYLDLM